MAVALGDVEDPASVGLRDTTAGKRSTETEAGSQPVNRPVLSSAPRPQYAAAFLPGNLTVTVPYMPGRS